MKITIEVELCVTDAPDPCELCIANNGSEFCDVLPSCANWGATPMWFGYFKLVDTKE